MELDYEQPLSERVNTVYFSPNSGTYAVIRLTPVAMVEDLDDPEALSAAGALQTKAYIVYIECALELPFPDKPWYRYNVCPIATSLRAEDKEEGYAPDMCAPIFPNTSHPRGRSPVRTVPDFPFNNCYHWAEFNTHIRVRMRPEKFDERRAILLPAAEQVKMDGHWGEDIPRMDELQRQYRAATGWQDPDAQPCASGDAEPLDRHHASASASTSSVNSSSSYADSALSDESGDSVDALVDIFSGPNEDVGLLPLVDLWLDLAENIKQEDITNPLEFLKERDAVVSIIQAARERAYAAANAPPPGTTSNPAESAPMQPRTDKSEEVQTKGSKRSLLRLPKLLQKWSSCLKTLKNRLRKVRVVRTPSIPV